MNFLNRLDQALAKRKQNLSYRELKDNTGMIDFTSNDYLGLARSSELAKIIHESALRSDIANGSTGSRLLSGHNLLTEQLEVRLAKLFKGERALLFNSGYTANLAVLSSLPQRNDTIIYDELAHACIKDGARLSLAKHFSFRHNDVNDLETKLKNASGQRFIAIESIYSMDGDTAPLQTIIQLSKQYNAIIILDEAHSTGVLGEGGNGMACFENLDKEIAIRIYTFGKAMGVHGACVVSNDITQKYLINFARPFIYTTAMTPHSIVAIDSAFVFLGANLQLQLQLKEKIEAFTSGFTNPSLKKIDSNSAIQSIVIEGNQAVRNLSTSLMKKNLDCRPILSPTVKEGSERIRICLHAFNSKTEINQLTEILNHYQP